MSYYLFLDDSRKPQQVNWVALPENVAWVCARSFHDFVYVIGQMGIPKFIAYDCDLCQEHYDAYFNMRERYVLHYKEFKERCGIHCLEYILKLCKDKGMKHPEAIVHSQNNYAKGFMENMIDAFNKGVKEIPSDIIAEVISPNDWLNQSRVPDYATHDEHDIKGFFGPYRFLSNFWPASVSWLGVNFPSVEVAYQAAKCADAKQLKDFVALTAAEAKKKGKSVIIRPDWANEKSKVMWHLVMQKFSQQPDLRDKLISTGNRYLMEANAWKDRYWGVYYHFNVTTKEWQCLGGQNHLGRILMEVRDLLK